MDVKAMALWSWIIRPCLEAWLVRFWLCQLIGKELVSVPVVKVHVVLIQCHEEKDVRRLNDEPDVPSGVAERESERRRDGLTLITLP